MILGMTLPVFTFVHVAISLIAQVLALVIFVVLGVVAVQKFHPAGVVVQELVEKPHYSNERQTQG